MKIQTCLLIAALSPFATFASDPIETLPLSVRSGTPNIDLRVRSETVDQDNFEDKGEALTARARVGYTTGKWNALDAQLEYEGLTSIGSDHRFNSSENGQADHPMVADPDVNEVNQAWVRWSGLPQTTIKYGRQRIVLDNARFVGNAGWRQNEITYDAALLTSRIIPRTTFTYAYVSNVDSFRFFDFDPTAAVDLKDDIDVSAHLVNASGSVIDKTLQLTAYAYLLDFHDIPAAPAARLFGDSKTLGVRATGAVPIAAFTFSYALEYAAQRDYADAASGTDADYVLAELTLGYGRAKGTVGHERLEGDGTYSFQTPLATAHAHQGWADQFLITPLDGLERNYVSLTGGVQKLSMTLTYHDFQSDRGGADYGSELDVLASFTPIENLVLSAKLARYDADAFPTEGTPAQSVDTTTSWLLAVYKF
jgi:hypothetical protein